MRALPWLALCACNHMPVAPPAPAAAASVETVRPLAVPGEAMEFRASLRGITVGTVQTALGQPGWIDGRRAIIVRSRGQSDGLAALLGEITWELQTTVDLDAGLPIVDREEAWIAVAGQHEHHRDGHVWSSSDRDHDVHSAIGLLRGWQAASGEHASVRVDLGGAHFPVVVWRAGSEVAANKPAIRYEGRVRDTLPFAIWISDDAARVPLQFRADTPLGTVEVQLVDYQITGSGTVM